MPIQIIITGNTAQEAMVSMADFIGMRGMGDVPIPPPYEGPATVNTQAPEGNGAAVEAVEVEAEPAPVKRSRGRPKTKSALPEERPEPDPVEVEVEAEQEIADEVNEPDIESDRDRVRAALNTHYVDVYGMDATVPDVLAMYKLRFPDGSVTRVSDIPAGMLETVIQDIKDMSRTNHFKRKRIDL
jgi:hypothetical protein